MLHTEREARRKAGFARAPERQTRPLPDEAGYGVADVSVGSFCEVAGSIGFEPSGATLPLHRVSTRRPAAVASRTQAAA